MPDMKVALHIIPVGGEEPVHWASPGCWCFPTRREDDVPPEWNIPAGTPCLLHNAQDAREKFERQGWVRNDHSWATIAGQG